MKAFTKSPDMESPSLSAEVEGKNGERRFGSVVEVLPLSFSLFAEKMRAVAQVDPKRNGKLVKLDMDTKGDYNEGDKAP